VTPDPGRSGPLAEHVRRRFERSSLRPRDAAWLIVVFWVVAVVVFGFVEHRADPDTFPTIWLALWWAVQTVTTVGYGDVVPEQPLGRALAAFLMLGGLSLLTIVTATITSEFVSRRQAQANADREDPILERLDEVARRLQAVEAEVRRLQRDEPAPQGPRP
jgi:voltage-gated potassium channel